MVTYWWSRQPGKFVDKTNGTHMTGVKFTGTTREWYETLIEVMIDVQNTVLVRSGRASMPYMSWRADPVIYPIVECSVLHKPALAKEIGVIGTFGCGYICNIPIETSEYLDGTGVLQLVQFAGSDECKGYGAIQIIDIGPNAKSVEVVDEKA